MKTQGRGLLIQGLIAILLPFVESESRSETWTSFAGRHGSTGQNIRPGGCVFGTRSSIGGSGGLGLRRNRLSPLQKPPVTEIVHNLLQRHRGRTRIDNKSL